MATALATLCALVFTSGALAQGRTIILAADEELQATGLIGHLVPRFALKTGIRVTLEVAGADDLATVAGAADAVLGPDAVVQGLSAEGRAEDLHAAFYVAGENAGSGYVVALVPGAAGGEDAARFVDWLTSEVGQRTVLAFAAEDGTTYRPGTLQVEAPAPDLPEGDTDAGEKLAHFHCGRCHVVSERNRYGGIGSTPSFAALRAIPDWEGKFTAFWALNPHPSFTQVEGLTEPFDPARPPHIAPVVITQDELDAIAAFAASIPPKDLGAEIQSR